MNEQQAEEKSDKATKSTERDNLARDWNVTKGKKKVKEGILYKWDQIYIGGVMKRERKRERKRKRKRERKKERKVKSR